MQKCLLLAYAESVVERELRLLAKYYQDKVKRQLTKVKEGIRSKQSSKNE